MKQAYKPDKNVIGTGIATIRPSSKILAEPAAVLSTRHQEALKNAAISFFELENKKARTSLEDDRAHWAKNIDRLEAKVNSLKSVLEGIAIENPHLKRNGVEGAGLKVAVSVFDYPDSMQPSKAVRMNVDIVNDKGKNLFHEEFVFHYSTSVIVFLDTKTPYDHLEKNTISSGDAHLFASYKDNVDKGMLLLRFNQVAERIMKETSG